ncbi:MAG: hypothetical protein IJS05_07555 [Paludibacteraceae bacterium]|nr:hypothetical protein [Paludibacteraceae bacterium]
MHNIPDFALQLTEVRNQLQVQTDITAQNWQDRKKTEFYETFVELMFEYIDNYINGGKQMRGMGVNDLMELFASSMDEMEKLTGVPADVQFELAALGMHDGNVNDAYGNQIAVEDDPHVINRGGVVHDSQGNRDYWDSWRNGPRPGEMKPKEINDLLENKQ